MLDSYLNFNLQNHFKKVIFW